MAPAQAQAVFSSVLEAPPATPLEAAKHFAAKLAFETDPSDVHADLGKGIRDFVVVDCRSPESFEKGHVPGAVNLPYRRMTSDGVRHLPKDKVLVTYCTSWHCNAST